VGSYLPGQALRLSVIVQSLGENVDPTTITMYTKDPLGNVTTYNSPTRDGVGLYHQDVVLSTSAATGTWLVKWVTTGSSSTQDGVVFWSFDVPALAF
jgi:uncharacterized protein YfaS (alpha-2-macroglobulin family)